MIVKHCDLAALRFCNRGARLFCERHGIDWTDFRLNGIDSSKLEHFDDEMIRKILDRAKQREEAGE